MGSELMTSKPLTTNTLFYGDNLRAGLNSDLGFTEQDRGESQRRVAEVARLFVDAGMVAIVATIAQIAHEGTWRSPVEGSLEQSLFLDLLLDRPDSDRVASAPQDGAAGVGLELKGR